MTALGRGVVTMSSTGAKRFVFVVMLVGLVLLAWPASAQNLFYETFEGGLSAWNTTYGQVVSSPVDFASHHQAVSFSGLKGGGDLMTIEGFTLEAGKTYHFSFDYLGFGDAGAWVAISPVSWQVPLYWDFSPGTLTNDGTWHAYEMDFSGPWRGSNTVWLAFEQYSGTPGDAYFDNVSVSVPEPMSFLALAGIFGLSGIARFRRRA